MKYAVPLFFAIGLFSPLAGAQGDPCEGITCPGGTCAVGADGSPVCVCNEGYAPDATGQGCLAVVAATPVQPEAAAPKTCPTGEEVMLQISKGRAIKQLVIWPIFFGVGTALWITGAVIWQRDAKLWPLHLALVVTGGFIAAASVLIIALSAARVARVNKRLRQCRGIACIDLGEEVDLAFQPSGLVLTF